MVKKPTLADMAAKKPAPAAPLPAEVPASTTAAEPAAVDRRKSIMVRVRPEGWKALRDLAATLTIESGKPVTMQSLILDQINELLRTNGRPPVA